LLHQLQQLPPIPIAQRWLASAAVGLGRNAAGEAASTQKLSNKRCADAESFRDLHPCFGSLVARRDDTFPQVK
jgi:hypothetical protein